ncbi:LysM peptidoglycan-binding domain-containing protein [Candidatus Competibacter phosphatis]|uniref:LysM peptidoglycan-binding domain-containing protein n=1 Tax=Candidatus Competibacter phosphatis TaxID=221280 RepID=UPI001FE8B92E|nr:LysM peptidoglycan-binding domain-containing protein [Candidatus Competibacter phosphatis]
MPSPFLKRLHWLLLGWLTASAAQATVYPLPPPDVDLIGQVKVVYATKEDTLIDIARRYSLGYDEIVHANPGVDRWAPGEGNPIVLPTRHILPDAPREAWYSTSRRCGCTTIPKPVPTGSRWSTPIR